MSNITAKARVQITVEVDAGAPWGEDCPIGQLFKQAKDAARENLLNSLKPGMQGILSIVGEPKVIGIITEKS